MDVMSAVHVKCVRSMPAENATPCMLPLCGADWLRTCKQASPAAVPHLASMPLAY